MCDATTLWMVLSAPHGRIFILHVDEDLASHILYMTLVFANVVSA
jgi:hypothetical protein